MKSLTVTLAAIVAVLAFAGTASAQIMEMNGTWKLNPERTLGPAPKEETLVYKVKTGEQAYTMDSIEADGRKGHNEWAAQYDGQDHPAVGGRGGNRHGYLRKREQFTQ